MTAGKLGASRGFTLIEMLVVLLIMGLLIGLVSTITRPDDRGRLKIEADRLARLLELAGNESRLSGKAIAWTADGPGYRFWRFTEEAGWSEVRDEELFRPRTLPAGMTISGLRVETLTPRGEPGVFRLEFAPYGETLAFAIDLSLGAVHYQVTGSPIGEVLALGDEGERHSQVF